MTLFQSLLLGIIEGLTEFIPVSSTAHMLIMQKLLNIPASDAMFAFLILVQIGPLLALILYFWADLLSLVKAFFAMPFSTEENKLVWYIIIATVPALLAGLLLKHVVEGLFKTPLLEASIRLVTAAILLTLAEFFGKRSRNLESMTWV
ncbi:MAG: undecaprenyl-diphosphate phosphatase, partial [Chloroflexota bacterium]